MAPESAFSACMAAAGVGALTAWLRASITCFRVSCS
jgi:hypothetical protein